MLVRIASYVSPIEAHLARGRLEAEGIPAFVCHEHHVGAYWYLALLLGFVKLYVHSNDVSRAAEVIVALQRGDYALIEEEVAACPQCRATEVVQARTSWRSAFLILHFLHLPLWFAWATHKCRACQHVWDLPNTRTYPLKTLALAIVFAAIISVSMLTVAVGKYCQSGTKHWLIFSTWESCRTDP